MAPWPKEKIEIPDGGSTAAEPRPETVRFQGIRVAYFCVDSDSTDEAVVLNRIVTLKEDTGKA